MKAPAVQKPNFKNPTVKHTQCLPEHITAFEPELLPGNGISGSKPKPSLCADLHGLPSPFGDVCDPIQVVKNGQRPSRKSGNLKTVELKCTFRPRVLANTSWFRGRHSSLGIIISGFAMFLGFEGSFVVNLCVGFFNFFPIKMYVPGN